MQEAFSFIKMYGRSFGLMLNKEKSEAFWIGNKMESKDNPLGIKWSGTVIKYLGIGCGPDVEGAISKNCMEKNKTLTSFLSLLSERQLSLKGKIYVLRSLALLEIL